MCSAKPFVLPAVAFVAATALLAARGVADETLTVVLSDGRTVTGIVDAHTDANFLWLRRSAEHLDLVSGYPWDGVLEGYVAGQGAGQRLAIDELRAWSAARKQAGRKFAELNPLAELGGESLGAALSVGQANSVKRLLIDAELAQWDSDAQSDGMRISVAPLDAQGRVVPVNGHIEFTLVVEREHTRREQQYGGGPQFEEGDRLTFLVKQEHFEAGAAFYELPFSKWHPDFERTLAPQALLHARLSVPGQGVFEASDAQVCLREVSRFRDQLQYYSPSRFLPLEHSSRDGR